MGSIQLVGRIVCGVALMFAFSQPLNAQERSVPPPSPSGTSTAYASQDLPFDLSTATPISGQPSSGLSTITLLTDSLGTKDPVTIAFAIVNLLLTLLGLVFLVLLIYAGVIWVLARGNEEEIGRAKNIIQRALFGLVIVLSSFGVSLLLFYVIGSISGEEITL